MPGGASPADGLPRTGVPPDPRADRPPLPGRPSTLLPEHVGAKSGQERTTPLVYVEDLPNLVIVASKDGHPRHPSWYHNLLAHPNTTIQVGADPRRGASRGPRGGTAFTHPLAGQPHHQRARNQALRQAVRAHKPASHDNCTPSDYAAPYAQRTRNSNGRCTTLARQQPGPRVRYESGRISR